MSDVVAVALITGGITAAVGFAGLAFNFWNSWQERQQRLAERRQDYQEWYRRTLFERRLDAVNEAYSWLMRLNDAINRATPDDPNSEDNQNLRMICHEARAWYNANAFYIHDGLPEASSFIGLLNAGGLYASGTDARIQAGIWQQFDEASEQIRKRADQILESEAKGAPA